MSPPADGNSRRAPVPAGEPPADTAHPEPSTPDPLEASALAGAFAADYLSWDESSREHRGKVLLSYLPAAVRATPEQAGRLGWSGKGRQRSEFALPGAVCPDGRDRVVVDVRVRVTPYRAVGAAAEPAYQPTENMEVAGLPSAAPAPTARGWKSLNSYWVRLAVPVIRDGDRLVVDTWDESLSRPPAPPDDAEPDPPATDRAAPATHRPTPALLATSTNRNHTVAPAKRTTARDTAASSGRAPSDRPSASRAPADRTPASTAQARPQGTHGSSPRASS